MENQGKITCLLLYGIQCLKAQSLPVGRIFSVDIADACSQEINAQIRDLLALVGIRTLAHAHYAVFLAADGAYLNGNSLAVCSLYQLRSLFDILVDGIMRTVKHNGREACLDTLIAPLKGTVIQMKRHRYVDIKILEQTVYHAHYRMISAHILAGAQG